jgi:hypothetical protein
MFLNSSTQSVFLPPLDIDEINKKMDSYVSSALKAYTDGYYVTYGDLFIPTTHFNTVPVDMVGQVPKLALMASKPLLAIVGSFVTAAAFLLFYLGVGMVQGTMTRKPLTLTSALWAAQRTHQFNSSCGTTHNI